MRYYVGLDEDNKTFYRVDDHLNVEVLRVDGTWGPSSLLAAELAGIGGDVYHDASAVQAAQHARALKGDTPTVQQ